MLMLIVFMLKVFYGECHNQYHYAEFVMLSVSMLNVIMLSVIMLNVVILSVIMLYVTMLNVVAPFYS
jgi:hypothetical protein